MLLLAPMQGLTELLFRKAFNRSFPGTFDLAISPFLSITHGNLRDAGKKVDDVLPEANTGSIPVVPQLLGHETEGFIDLANRLFDLGYDEVNWNMGCPMRRVAGKHRGSGILPYPDEVLDILDTVMPRLKPELSVKLRLGYRSNDEIDRIIPILNEFPIKNVTIHPRIGKQMYSGLPDLEKFSKILPLVEHPVIYNGDICSVYDYKKIRSSFPQVKDVMIGRGALYNPLLPLQIREACPSDFTTKSKPSSTANGFINDLMDDIISLDISTEAKCRKMKEYWCLFLKGLPGSELSKREVLHATRLEEIRSLIFSMTK